MHRGAVSFLLLLLAFVASVGVGAWAVEARSATPTTEANKELVRRFFAEVLSGGNPAAAGELIAPDARFHIPEGEVVGPDGLLSVLAPFAAAFPGAQVTPEEMIAEGDKVAVRWRLRAMHQGSLLGEPPTGKAVTMGGISILRIDGSRIVEDWVEQDTIGLLIQIGVMPVPGGATTPVAGA